ncbi:DUF58 domain-containing protein [Solwaraspora sp. WMMD1047]|uniref:DUF58 domain-containing protein n=1 Tax=Solwaraspora sp. WMMD1047 TaxID=3016102 RepID=UPI0024168978|nr:DUF58 domain-containing protein [Solwaraspora sp. WMMD1047]MDG4828616.1 DUF58 domain-containing protein [Solwaraspora sp. WMMD1047]
MTAGTAAPTTLRAAVPGAAGHAPSRPDEPTWAPTRALGRAVLITGVLLVAGVLLGRVDLIVLAVPFALGTAYALHRRPVEAPRIGLAAEDGSLVEGGDVTASVAVGNPDRTGYDLVLVRTVVSPWLRLDRSGFAADGGAPGPKADGAPEGAGGKGADRPFALGVPAGTAEAVELAGEALRWGRHQFGPAATRAAACDGLVTSRLVVSDSLPVRVYPVTEPFDADEAMPRAAGLVGGHRSRRPGEGGELAGVRIFGPGDRLRRIDWRVSLRARQLHVAATLSDRDAEVVLLLDVLAEAGTSGGIGGTASVLDTTVRAAAAIGEHYLHRGDRVSMLEYGPAARRLRPATGRRQYLILLEWLLDVRATPSPYEPYDQVFGPHLLSSNALVVVLTPLVDPRSAAMLARLARSGRIVVAVDTLPAAAAPPQRGPFTDVAHRLWRLDRDNTIGQLREHGVPVVGWAGAGSLDLVLRDVARLASAPKAMLR